MRRIVPWGLESARRRPCYGPCNGARRAPVTLRGFAPIGDARRPERGGSPSRRHRRARGRHARTDGVRQPERSTPAVSRPRRFRSRRRRPSRTCSRPSGTFASSRPVARGRGDGGRLPRERRRRARAQAGRPAGRTKGCSHASGDGSRARPGAGCAWYQLVGRTAPDARRRRGRRNGRLLAGRRDRRGDPRPGRLGPQGRRRDRVASVVGTVARRRDRERATRPRADGRRERRRGIVEARHGRRHQPLRAAGARALRGRRRQQRRHPGLPVCHASACRKLPPLAHPLHRRRRGRPGRRALSGSACSRCARSSRSTPAS